MLIMAEGTANVALPDQDKAAMRAWLGPMVDAGVLQVGYLDAQAGRVWMVLSADDAAEARQRISDLPAVRSGQITFTTRPVTALRFA